MHPQSIMLSSFPDILPLWTPISSMMQVLPARITWTGSDGTRWQDPRLRSNYISCTAPIPETLKLLSTLIHIKSRDSSLCHTPENLEFQVPALEAGQQDLVTSHHGGPPLGCRDDLESIPPVWRRKGGPNNCSQSDRETRKLPRFRHIWPLNLAVATFWWRASPTRITSERLKIARIKLSAPHDGMPPLEETLVETCTLVRSQMWWVQVSVGLAQTNPGELPSSLIYSPLKGPSGGVIYWMDNFLTLS